jgi:spore maturation protein CgeB
MHQLRIAFFGSSLVSSYWNGAATYYRGIIHALAQRGHDVTFYEPDAFERQQHRDLEDPCWARVVVYQPGSEQDVRGVVKLAAGADLVVKASGVGVHDAVLEESVLELQSRSTRVVFWDVDAPATLERVHVDPQDPFRRLIPRYDMILTYGGGDPVIMAYHRLGARRCIPVYNALDPATHHPVEALSGVQADLSFLGNRLPDREDRVDEFFFRTAASLPEFSFMLGGSGWEGKKMSKNVRYIGHVPTGSHNEWNCSSRVVLNISRDSMAKYGFSPATRVFEAAGAASCMITDAWDGIDLFLEPGHEVLVAKDHQEVVAHLRAVTIERAREIGRAARRRILAEHTYDKRVKFLEELLFCNNRFTTAIHG